MNHTLLGVGLVGQQRLRLFYWITTRVVDNIVRNSRVMTAQLMVFRAGTAFEVNAGHRWEQKYNRYCDECDQNRRLKCETSEGWDRNDGRGQEGEDVAERRQQNAGTNLLQAFAGLLL